MSETTATYFNHGYQKLEKGLLYERVDDGGEWEPMSVEDLTSDYVRLRRSLQVNMALVFLEAGMSPGQVF